MKASTAEHDDRDPRDVRKQTPASCPLTSLCALWHVFPPAPNKQSNETDGRDTSSLKALCWEQVTPVGSPRHITVGEDLLLTLFGN